MSHAREPCDGVATARAAYSPHALSPMSTVYNNLALPRLDHTTCLPALRNFFRTYHSSWLASARSVVFVPTLTASEEGTYPALTHELLPSVTHSLLTGSNLSYLNPYIFICSLLPSPFIPVVQTSQRHASRQSLHGHFQHRTTSQNDPLMLSGQSSCRSRCTGRLFETLAKRVSG